MSGLRRGPCPSAHPVSRLRRCLRRRRGSSRGRRQGRRSPIAPRQTLNTRDHGARRRCGAAVGDQLAHARELIEARLDDIEHGLVRADGAVVDLHHERFQLVAQVAHGRDARHPGAALERVQRSLEGRAVLGAAGVRAPGGERLLRGVNELRGLFGKDGRNLGVEVAGVFDHLAVVRRRAVDRERHVLSLRSSRLRDALIERPVRLGDALHELHVVDEITGRLVQMHRHRFHRDHAVGKQDQVLVPYAQAAVECPAQPVIERLGEANALAGLRHLGAARERVTGAIDLLRKQVRLRKRRLALQVRANRRDVRTRLARIDLAQNIVRAGLVAGIRDLFRSGSLQRGLTLPRTEILHGRRRLDGRHRSACAGGRLGGFLLGLLDRRGAGGGRLAPGCQRVGARRDRRHIHRRRTAGLQVLDEPGERAHGLPQHLEDCLRSGERIVEHAVQKVLDGPGKLAEVTRPDHASAALERVEGAAHGDERLALQRVVIPDGEATLDLGELLVRFLGKQLHQLGVRVFRQRSDFGGARARERRRRAFNSRRGRIKHVGRVGERRRKLQRALEGGGLERRHGGHGRAGLQLERLHTRLRVIEHVPGIAAAGLQRLHVVLHAHDGVGQPIHEARRLPVATGLHDSLQLRGDGFDDFHGSCLAEHQQARLQAAHQFLPAVEPRGIERAAGVLRHGLLDAREIENALAQYGRLHLLELAVTALLRQLPAPGQDQADQAIVQLVLDADQRGGDLDQQRLARLEGAGDDLLQALGLRLHARAQVAQTQHPEGVADLAQQLDLGAELLRLGGAAAHEDIEDVLHLGEVLADGRGDRLHELHARRRQVLPLLLDALIDGQQLRQPERGAHRRDARPRGLRATDVIEQVVQQLDGGRLRIPGLALLEEAADFAVAQAEQPLHRHAALETVLLERFDDRADHPPQLEQRLAGGDLFQLLGDGGQDVEVLLDALAADPANEADLVTRAQPPCPLLHRERPLAGRRGERLRLLVGLEIEQQQRAFRQQRAAAHGPQVVQQRQQHQCQVAPAGQHPLEIARQLHHRPHERIEALGLALALARRGEQVARDLLHLLGEQRRPVDLQQAQHALHLVQLLGAALEQRHVVRLLDVVLERGARLRERRVQLTTDNIERLGSDFRHAGLLQRMDHEPPSAEMCRTVAVDALVSSSRLKAPVGSMVAPGRRKPVAALRNPADSSASLAMAAEVALVDSAVWALISFSTPMLRAMFCAAPVCWRALPEMFCTRLAIWFDTCSISSRAAPAFSASSAPPTTSVVLRSIDTTASLVSV